MHYRYFIIRVIRIAFFICDEVIVFCNRIVISTQGAMFLRLKAYIIICWNYMIHMLVKYVLIRSYVCHYISHSFRIF